MKNIIKKILPDQITNKFEGNKIAQYVFLLIIVITIGRSLIHILAADGGAQSIAGFPLDTYPQVASSMVILIFSLWGASQLLMGFVYLAVYAKYKSLIPAMYVLIFVEYLTRFLLGVYKPVISIHVVPGGVGDYVMIPLALIMLVLSLRTKK